MVWYGIGWIGLVWFGLVWFGLVWFGLVWYHPQRQNILFGANFFLLMLFFFNLNIWMGTDLITAYTSLP